MDLLSWKYFVNHPRIVIFVKIFSHKQTCYKVITTSRYPFAKVNMKSTSFSSQADKLRPNTREQEEDDKQHSLELILFAILRISV